MSDPTVTAFLTKVLCKHGGRLLKNVLSELLELPIEQIEQILQEEPQKFPQVGELVLARSPVRICNKYLKEDEEECDKLHLCQNYLRGNCKRPQCTFSHDIFSHHNRTVLKANELSGLNEDEIKVLLFQNDNQLLPRVCVKYLHDKCELGNNCSWLHICGFFTRGECNHRPCKRSHHLLEFGYDLLLTRYRMSEKTIQNFQMICTVKHNERLQAEGKKDQEKGQPGAQRGRRRGRPQNRKKGNPQGGTRSKSRGQRQERAGFHSQGRLGSRPVSESGESHLCSSGEDDDDNSQITPLHKNMPARCPSSVQPLMSLETHPPTPTAYTAYVGHCRVDVQSTLPSVSPKVSPQPGIPTGHSSSSSTPSAPQPKWTTGQVTSIHPVDPPTVSAAEQSKPVNLPIKGQSDTDSVRPVPSTVVNPSTAPVPPPRPSKMVNSPMKGPSVPREKLETTTITSPNKTQPVDNLTSPTASPSSTSTTSHPRLVDSPTEGPSVQRVKPVQSSAASSAQTNVKPISQTELEDIYKALLIDDNLENWMTINPSDTGHQAKGTSVNGASYLPPKRSEPDKAPKICLSNIWKYCKLGGCCPDMHYYLPYCWQIYKGTGWEDISNMEEIEKCYCDPKVDRVPSADFLNMRSGVHRVRRLSTVSSVMKPPEYVLATEWLWYWKDEYGTWTQYGNSNVKQVSSTILSSDLENIYLSDPTAVIPFTAGSQRYEINFREMKQKNILYKTEKDVRRRPKYLSFEDVKLLGGSTKSSATKSSVIYPRTWDTSALPEIGHKKVPVSVTSSEFSEIVSSFTRTVSGYVVKKLWRLQNPSLWQVFQWQKEQMKKVNQGQDVKEMRLFHGTDTTHIDAICNHNFDWRLCGIHGVAYGQGSYFARDASYSNTYSAVASDETQSMFVARVLVGDYVEGSPQMKRPPQRPGSATRYYDSCVDKMLNPSIFVVFEMHQIYPEYLLEYEQQQRSWAFY